MFSNCTLCLKVEVCKHFVLAAPLKAKRISLVDLTLNVGVGGGNCYSASQYCRLHSTVHTVGNKSNTSTGCTGIPHEQPEEDLELQRYHLAAVAKARKNR